MGNHMSCVSAASAMIHDLHYSPTSSAASTPAPPHPALAIRVLHADTGAITELQEPITAAEVMMEFPGHFVCCYSSSTTDSVAHMRGWAAAAVPADAELRLGKLYVLLAMHRLNGRLSQQEMAFFNSHLKRSISPEISINYGYSSQANVDPILSHLEAATRRPLRSSSAIFLDVNNSPHRPSAISMCRSKSWLPKLETIQEARAVF